MLDKYDIIHIKIYVVWKSGLSHSLVFVLGGSMAKVKIKDFVAEHAEKICRDLNLELVDVEYKKEGKDWYLRVYIYKKDGISIDDCVDVTKALNVILDAEDPIDTQYILEVSSPGLDRPLKGEKDFERYSGEKVDVSLFAAIDGIKEFQGKLLGLEDNKVVIDDNGNVLKFDLKDVSTVKRAIIF